MAFMQETIRSLRAFLILSGVIAAAAQIQGVFSEQAGPLGRVLSLVGLAIGVAYTWIGITLRSLLASAPRLIEQVLVAGAAYSLLLLILVVAVYPSPELAARTIGSSAVGLLVTLYLLRNVRRLAREGQGDTGAKSHGSAT